MTEQFKVVCLNSGNCGSSLADTNQSLLAAMDKLTDIKLRQYSAQHRITFTQYSAPNEITFSQYSASN